MQHSQQAIEQATIDIKNALGEVYKWGWEEARQVLLSEFSQDKSNVAIEILRQNFVDEWNHKSFSKAPKAFKKALKTQLGPLAKLSKEQRLFTRPASDEQPAVIAIWWPWGHGGTYSLRLLILNESYDLTAATQQNSSFLDVFKNLFCKKIQCNR